MSSESYFYYKWNYGQVKLSQLYRTCRHAYDPKNISNSSIKFVKKKYCYRLPWDQNTIKGWIAEVVFILIAVMFYLIIVPAILTFLISIYKYHGTFYKIF